jgi:signal transduction histidine kinase/ligand-binding sensor domain-containing protein/DNA-binding response OmpR family regulator
LCPCVLPAQTDQYRFLRLGTDNGLSHNRVNCILQDSRGFMWFGTMSGLNRYDGYNFHVFKHDLRDSTTLIDDYIAQIMEGPDRKLWIQTRNGLNIYDPLTEKFNRSPEAYLKELAIPDGGITDIHKDKKGNFWLIHPKYGLFKYLPATRTTKRIMQPGNVLPGIVAGFGEDSQGFFWVIYQDGLIEKLDNETNAVIYRTTALTNLTKGELLGYNLFIDKQDELWIYVPGAPKGIYYYNPFLGVIRPINTETGAIHLNRSIVNGVLQDKKGKIWIGTDHGGVNLLDKKDFSIRYLLNNNDDNKSLSQNSIIAMHSDNSGIVWIGTYKQGINYYYENSIQFALYRRQPSNPNSLSYDDVNRFAEDKRGNLWIGTNGGGLIYFDRESGKFKQFLHDPDNPNSLANDVIVSLWIDHQQKLWIGTYYGGLDCYDGKNFTHYRHDPKDTSTISDDRVWEIYEDSQNNLWVGTLGGGVNLLDRKKNSFYRFGGTSSVSYVFAFMEDRDGNFWIGTMDGLDLKLKEQNKVVHYVHQEKDHSSLSNNNILCILQDSRGMTWIGTREGLNLFDKKTNSFRTFRTEDGLPDNTILNILEDDKANLWISTPNGISKAAVAINKKPAELALQFKNYDEMDGLQGKEFNENAAWKSSRGELIFGGAKGFNIFYPDNAPTNKTRPTVVLTDFEIFNKSMKVGDKSGKRVILEKAIPETKEITLAYKDNVIAIEFAALNFSNTEKSKYAYKLEGFNKEWLLTDAGNRKATYTNLDPGEYTFRVKASNEDGLWNEEGVTLKITVLPPIWRTPLAYIIYGLFAIGLLWLGRRIVVQRTRMRFQMEQERKESQRMHKLDLMKIRFFTNVSHEFRTPLALILTPIEKMLKSATDATQKSHYQLIHRNAKRLLNLVNQLLDFRKLEMDELYLNFSQDDMVRLVKDIGCSFSDIAEKKNIRFSFHSHVDKVVASFDKVKLERILFNLLSNAFKFTHEGGQVEMELNSRRNEGDNRETVIITVKDTGIGISPQKKDRIFERFFQDELPGDMLNQGSGIGLAITKEFVRLHGGTIRVDSEPGKGSCFTIELPVISAPVVSGEPVENGEIAEAALANGNGHLVPENGNGHLSTEIKVKTGQKVNGKKFSILLAEDNEDFRFYLKDNLREAYEIIEAKNGKEGWQKALGQHPDLVVSDIMMPEMSGIDLCRKLKDDVRTSHIPVILLTARSSEEIQMEGFSTGANDYITKPFNFQILISRINNLLVQQQNLKKSFQKQIEINPSEIKVDSEDEKLLRQTMEIVQKNLDNPDFSVEDLSKALLMSRAAMYKKITALTGITPSEFIRSVRLKSAAQLLEKTKMTVAQVAFEVGFNNTKYFVKYFKEEYNMLPTAYRSSRQKKETQG